MDTSPKRLTCQYRLHQESGVVETTGANSSRPMIMWRCVHVSDGVMSDGQVGSKCRRVHLCVQTEEALGEDQRHFLGIEKALKRVTTLSSSMP